MLPTIVSRSARLTVTPVSDPALERALLRAGQDPDAELVAFAAGRTGVLTDPDPVRGALQDARELTNALGESAGRPGGRRGAGETLRSGVAPRDAALHVAGSAPHVRARADTALTALQEALEAYASPSLSFQVFALALRDAFGHA